MCGLSRVGCLGTWEWVGAEDAWGMGMEGIGSVSSIWGWGVVVSGVGLRPCVVGGGFHALYWNMLSWLEFGRYTWVLRCLRRGWVLQDVSGGCMLGLVRVEVAWFIYGGRCVGW